MKKENNDKILKSSLSTLLKRFSNTDVVGNIEKEYRAAYQGQLSLSFIDDNHIYKNVKINKDRLKIEIDKLSGHRLTSPLIVRSTDEGRYEIIYPRLTYYACLSLQLETANCYVVDIDEEEMLLLMASQIKNDKDANVVELSFILNRLVKKYHFVQKDLAELMNLSRSQITNIMRLKNLPTRILSDLINGKISFGHVRAMMTLSESEMDQLLEKIYENNLSVRDVEKMIYMEKNDVDYSNIEQSINKKYNCAANIGSNRVTIRFEDSKSFQKFLKKIAPFVKK